MKRTYKKLTAVLLVLSLMLLMLTACGSAEKTEDRKVKAKDSMDADIAAVDTLDDAIRLLKSFKEGSYDFGINLRTEDGKLNLNLKMYGNTNGSDMDASLRVDGAFGKESYTKELDDLFCIKDNSLYVNIDKALSFFTDKKTEFGSFGIVLPDTDKEQAAIYYGEILELSSKLIAAAFEGIELKKGNGSFSVRINGAEDVKLVIGNVLDWFEKNQDDLIDLAYSAKDYTNVVDIKKYAGKLIDSYYDDIVAAFGVFGENSGTGGSKIPEDIKNCLASKEKMKEAAEKYLDSLYSDFDSEFDKEEFAAEYKKDLEYLKQAFEQKKDSLAKAYPVLEKLDIVFMMEMSSDAYTVSISGSVPEAEGNSSLDVSFSFERKPVEIKIPDNVKNIPELAEYYAKNTETVNGIISDIEKNVENMVWAMMLTAMSEVSVGN